MTAPLLSRLERELSLVQDPIRRGELIAEQACYLARIGAFGQAHQRVSELRQHFGSGESPRVSIWIMLVEGLLLYYEKFASNAQDRLIRAHTLSAAIGDQDLIQLTASWLAHMEFNRSDFRAMIVALRKCQPIQGSPPTPWQARAQMVIANSFAYLGKRSDSRKWYGLAHSCAIALGDEAQIEAVIFNRAAFSFARYRIEVMDGSPDERELRLLELEIESARNFYLGAGHGSLPQLLEACTARASALRKDYKSAADTFQKLLATDRYSAYLPDRPFLKLEYGICLQNLGEFEMAKAVYDEIANSDYTTMGLDDQLVHLHCLLIMARSLKDEEKTNRYTKLKDEVSLKYRDEISELSRLLETLDT